MKLNELGGKKLAVRSPGRGKVCKAIFKPTLAPQRVIPGLREIFIKRYIVEKIQLKGPERPK